MDDVMAYRLAYDGTFKVVRDGDDAQMGGYFSSGSLACVGDTLYYAADRWCRINLTTGEEESLPAADLPGDGSGYPWRLAYSTHYGLVGFRCGRLYRIKVDGMYIR
jgi:hypothetical protein